MLCYCRQAFPDEGCNRGEIVMSGKKETGGIGFFGLLQIAFIVLKLCGVIAWSWWWVLLPIWAPLSLILLFVLFVFGLKVYIRNKKKRK